MPKANKRFLKMEFLPALKFIQDFGEDPSLPMSVFLSLESLRKVPKFRELKR